MMKKRLFAFGLAGVMLMGMSMNVFAENTNVTNQDAQNKELNVNYEVPVSYTVSIPTALKFDSTTENNDLVFSQSVLILHDQGKVTIKSDKTEVDLSLTDNNAVKYKVSLKKNNGTDSVDQNEIASFTNSEKESTTVKVKGSDTAATVAGEYTGSVNFTIFYSNGKTES